MRKYYFKHDGKYYKASAFPRDYKPDTVGRLTQHKTTQEVSEQEYQDWNHSECQTACVRRGAEKCVW